MIIVNHICIVSQSSKVGTCCSHEWDLGPHVNRPLMQKKKKEKKGGGKKKKNFSAAVTTGAITVQIRDPSAQRWPRH